MKENLKRFIPFALSALTIGVTLIIQFAVFSINEKFDVSEFLPKLIINIFLLVTTAIIWINSGTDRAKREEKSTYKTNSATYAQKIQKVTDENKLGELREFCRVKTEEIRDNKITALLASVGIDRKTYDSELYKLSRSKLVEEGYNRRQIRVVERIKNGKVKVKAVRAMELISDRKTPDDCGVNYDEQADKAARISFRALRAIFTALVLAALVIEPAQDITNIATWVMFFMRLFTIVWTAYSSEHEGYARITETKNKVILRRIAFLHEFDEWVWMNACDGESKQKEESGG